MWLTSNWIPRYVFFSTELQSADKHTQKKTKKKKPAQQYKNHYL